MDANRNTKNRKQWSKQDSDRSVGRLCLEFGFMYGKLSERCDLISRAGSFVRNQMLEVWRHVQK